jgi:hypothetical protein
VPALFSRCVAVAGLFPLCLRFPVLTPEHTFIVRPNLFHLATQIAVGALIIGVMTYGLLHMHVDQHWQCVVRGLVILGATLLDPVNDRCKT